MAVGHLGLARDERHVELVSTKLHHRIAGRAFGYLDLNAGMGFPIMTDQLREKAAWDQGMDADAKPATFSLSCHAGGLHRVIELIDTRRDTLHEVPACVC